MVFFYGKFTKTKSSHKIITTPATHAHLQEPKFRAKTVVRKCANREGWRIRK